MKKSVLQSGGYWGRAAMDPEPGRCRRTDGKKWRCSRDVVTGKKYCERHMHRGRNRSRKPVEAPTPTMASTGGAAAAAADGHEVLKTNSHPVGAQSFTMSSGTHFALSEPSPSIDLLYINQRALEAETENKGLLFQSPNVVPEDNKSSGQILRHFFDDWPRSVQEPDNARSNASLVTSATSLSISFPGDYSSSDFSLKLSTGNNRDEATRGSQQQGSSIEEGERPQLNWAAAWGTNQQVSSMGGPLAEALRSSTSKSSPTSVLHQLPRGAVSEASYISTCI